MSDKLRESVSALIDGEADELELRRLLAAEEFSLARQTWTDFQRGRGSLQGVDAAIARLDISARVQSELSDVALPATARWWRPVASVAVAASMAAAVVVGMRGLSIDSPLQNGGSVAVADATMTSAVSGNDAKSEPVAAFPNAGRVVAPVPLRSSTVSATYGGVPSNMVPGQVYAGSAQSRAEAEALVRRRLQQYLLMQVEQSQNAAAVSHP